MDRRFGLGLGMGSGVGIQEYAHSKNFGLSDQTYTDLQSIVPVVYRTFGELGFGLSDLQATELYTFSSLFSFINQIYGFFFNLELAMMRKQKRSPAYQ